MQLHTSIRLQLQIKFFYETMWNIRNWLFCSKHENSSVSRNLPQEPYAKLDQFQFPANWVPTNRLHLGGLTASNLSPLEGSKRDGGAPDWRVEVQIDDAMWKIANVQFISRFTRTTRFNFCICLFNCDPSSLGVIYCRRDWWAPFVTVPRPQIPVLQSLIKPRVIVKLFISFAGRARLRQRFIFSCRFIELLNLVWWVCARGRRAKGCFKRSSRC